MEIKTVFVDSQGKEIQVPNRLAELLKDCVAEVKESSDYSVSINAEIVDDLATILDSLGFEVSYPGQDEVRDGVTYTAIHIERK